MEELNDSVQEILTDPGATENAITLLDWFKDNTFSAGILGTVLILFVIDRIFKYVIKPRFTKQDDE